MLLQQDIFSQAYIFIQVSLEFVMFNYFWRPDDVIQNGRRDMATPGAPFTNMD